MKARESRESHLGDPFWYKDAIFYEIRIRSFADSDGDGIGDFRGATDRLDYLKDLGVTVLWLLPFYPSPGRDDGYDIADYMNVHPDVGTLQDFKVFLREAHARGLRVMTELVVNHTSDQHPWFQEARRAPVNSSARNFYIWSDTQNRFPEARIIFKDFETSNWTWDPVAKAYYWHRFYSHQPDLNFDNPRVQQAVIKVLDFWLKLGVDGLRLDAIPYLYKRDETNCENLPETHAFLKQLRSFVDAHYQNRILLAEANQWPEDAVTYFGNGDEAHMAFHFPIMPRLFMSIHMEEHFPIIDILNQTPDLPANSQWAIFLRNHDELTLEMVSEEERDYMYRIYANDTQARINLGIRRRLAPLMGNDRKKIELMNALLFSLPGTPVMYYGDEIGMGDNFFLGDRNGVRTPMQWNPDRNAGFSRANPQQLILPVIVDPQYHYEMINVEMQQRDPHSLLWWTKRLIALRKRYQAFGRGSMEILQPENSKVLAFARRYQDELVLVVCNLSRFAQYTSLDLSQFCDMVPVEIFGNNEFPRIEDRPYFFMLGPYSFYWFVLKPAATPQTASDRDRPCESTSLQVSGIWTNVLKYPDVQRLENVLPRYLTERRWFQSKAKLLRSVKVIEIIPITKSQGYLTILQLNYDSEDTELYCLPLSFASGENAEQLRSWQPEAVIANLIVENNRQILTGIIYDGVNDPAVCRALLHLIERRRSVNGMRGKLIAQSYKALDDYLEKDAVLNATVQGFEQSNTSIRFEDRMIFKLVRKVSAGVSPELEIGRFLNSKPVNVSPLLGSLEYQLNKQDVFTLGVLNGYIQNRGDAWRYTIGWLGRYLENRITCHKDDFEAILQVPTTSPMLLSLEDIPESAHELLDGYLNDVRILGKRTAEMHLALALSDGNEAFAPEAYSKLYQRSLYQSMRNLSNRVLRPLQHYSHPDSSALEQEVTQVVALKNCILGVFQRLSEAKRPLTGKRIRIHGDYHLGQVLYTGNDFAIIDFEGEPGRALSERQLKRSPLRDVAGMLRSFHYAAYAALPGFGTQSFARKEDFPQLEPWARFWQVWTSVAFLKAYLPVVECAGILPKSLEERDLLLRIFVLEKALYELEYEMNNRPGWLRVPMQTIIQQFAEED